MKTLYIHAGGPKTGSTSIQAFATRERERLVDLRRLYYPKSGSTPIPHWDNVEAHYLLFMPQHRPGRDLEPLWRELAADVARQAPDSDILLSSEDIAFDLVEQMSEGERAAFVSKIQSHFPDYKIKIIIYIRRMDDEFKSRFNNGLKFLIWDWERLKDADFAYNDALSLSMRAITGKLPLETRAFKPASAFLKDLIETFGRENVIVRLYDRTRLKEGNIVIDVFEAMGRELTDDLLTHARGIETNPKVPDEALPYLLQLLRALGGYDNDAATRTAADDLLLKIKTVFDSSKQGAGAGAGLEAEIEALIDEYDRLAPGYRDLFKDRPCDFSFPAVDMDPKELLMFDLLFSLYKNDVEQKRVLADLKADLKALIFPNAVQSLMLLCCRPFLKMILSPDDYKACKREPADFFTEKWEGPPSPQKRGKHFMYNLLRLAGPMPRRPQ